MSPLACAVLSVFFAAQACITCLTAWTLWDMWKQEEARETGQQDCLARIEMLRGELNVIKAVLEEHPGLNKRALVLLSSQALPSPEADAQRAFDTPAALPAAPPVALPAARRAPEEALPGEPAAPDGVPSDDLAESPTEPASEADAPYREFSTGAVLLRNVSAHREHGTVVLRAQVHAARHGKGVEGGISAVLRLAGGQETALHFPRPHFAIQRFKECVTDKTPVDDEATGDVWIFVEADGETVLAARYPLAELLR